MVPVNQNTTPTQPDESQNVKIDNTNKEIAITPSASFDEIKNAVGNNITIKNKKGEIVTDSNKISTGSIVNDEFVIIKKGDANADGVVNTFDYIRIMNYIMGNKTLSEDEKLAADANADGKVNSFDYIRIMNYIMGNKKIEL